MQLLKIPAFKFYGTVNTFIIWEMFLFLIRGVSVQNLEIWIKWKWKIFFLIIFSSLLVFPEVQVDLGIGVYWLKKV